MTDRAPAMLQVGFWDGTVAVIRLQPSDAAAAVELSDQTQGASQDVPQQHGMVVLSHFQVEPLPIRAVAWCPPQVSHI